MARTCCVPDCKSGNQAPRHKFPKDPVRCSQWVRSLNLSLLENACASDLHKYRVCYRHFREEDYSCSLHNRTLISTAIPVRHINDNTDIIAKNKLQPLQRVSKEDDQQSENLQSVLMDMPQLKEQQVWHGEQLTILQNKVYEIEQKVTTDMMKKNEPYLIYTNKRKQTNITDKYEKRFERINERLEMISKRNRVLRRRPDSQKITYKKNLTPIARMLYDTTVLLRPANTRLKRLMRCQREQHRRKATVMHNKISNDV